LCFAETRTTSRTLYEARKRTSNPSSTLRSSKTPSKLLDHDTKLETLQTTLRVLCEARKLQRTARGFLETGPLAKTIPRAPYEARANHDNHSSTLRSLVLYRQLLEHSTKLENYTESCQRFLGNPQRWTTTFRALYEARPTNQPYEHSAKPRTLPSTIRALYDAPNPPTTFRVLYEARKLQRTARGFLETGPLARTTHRALYEDSTTTITNLRPYDRPYRPSIRSSLQSNSTNTSASIKHIQSC